ncbi:MAG: asparaginase domain-containing protein [Acutalibacteraceae bacterium]|nr:asparaginase domain-containing protein [Acutalibacteraceae bacterium]
MCEYKTDKPKILVILTGGTICCSTNDAGLRFSDAEGVKIIDAFKKSNSPYSNKITFDKKIPLDILSENMTTDSWNTLLSTLKDTNFDEYKGVIILHGTDTLAFTASLLSITLAGLKIPVCLVSSQLPLDNKATNGHANFKAAVELIMNGIAPNVYTVYRNSDNVIYLHYGAHLKQCENYSDDFLSRDAVAITDINNAQLDGRPFETNSLYLNKISPLCNCVLNISPYVGINYGAYNLEKVKAVVHTTYHSQTVCVQRSHGTGKYDETSVLHLIDRCKQKNIPLFLTPCSDMTHKYESTGDALTHGANYIFGMTKEMAYVKTLVGCALNLNNEELVNFLNKSINHEIIYI